MTIRLKPHRASLLVDEKDLRAWVAAAKSGDVVEYHRGVLAIDRLVHGSRLDDRDRQQLDRVADLLFKLAGFGYGHLLQRRNGSDDYSYLFVFRPRSLDSRFRLLATLEAAS